MTAQFQVEFEPIGKRVRVSGDTNLLTAAQKAGADMAAVCGGVGICGSCLVRWLAGNLTPTTQLEFDVLSKDQIEQNLRLACQVFPMSDVKVEIPPESLPGMQLLQIDGLETLFDLAPVVIALDVKSSIPTSSDLRSDFTRADQAVQQAGYPPLRAELSSIVLLSEKLRNEQWKVRLAITPKINSTLLVTTLAENTPLAGLAVDMGSTKLALYLVDLASGITLAKSGVMNPQISYGEDIVSRIAFANQSVENQTKLQTRLVDTLNSAIADMCNNSGVSQAQIVDAVLVGNTAMHHFFCRLPVEQLGTAPYVAAVTEPLDFHANEVGLAIAPGAWIHTPANIAGYIGGDHTSVLLTLTENESDQIIVVVDIGTNTEISLLYKGAIYSCSTASGPAFEGAHIQDGMRASPGAIDKVRIQEGQISVTTIGNAPAVGICGTGILSAVSEMLEHHVIDKRGSMNSGFIGVRRAERSSELVLVNEEDSGTGRAIVVTRKDVHEIQLAKGAIRTGIDVLLQSAGISANKVDRWVIAGAFGTFLDLNSAIRIGMFPKVDLERYHQVGNAAGVGAKQMLLSRHKRTKAYEIVKKVKYIELTNYPDFTDKFMQSMYFPEVIE